ncbi:hypothetical protein [Mycolicibacterium pallens]|uniref:Uncharacterized protein n=1 Tax=Mycolicibacterium pallens TaxID=370524 RepID=A0ABX8VH39_9MYCO|nr:hypothetical protein [Mycolicibacterium pallens]APE14235.1 hypothetical protein BOH72_02315 [Mycobacterium sp. WY10]QYL15301.1 hypothetical protein K0O64_19500 [Mycolicibacterium pallens]
MYTHTPARPAPRVIDTRPTVLITEHDATMLAATTVLPHTKAGMVSRWIAAHRAAHEARVDHRRLVAHYEFLEHSAMARAMEHL